MTRRRLGWLLSMVALVAAPALTTMVAGQGSGATRKAEAALQAAMNKETVAGDLAGAIKDYNAIVTQYGRSEQPIAAQALMRVAGAYEKLGKTAESRQVYAQIAKDYSHIARGAGDQMDIVAAARARYAALTPAPPQAPGIRPRRVMTVPQGLLTSMSADGALAGPSRDGLVILNLASGQTTRLGVDGSSPVFSQDAKQIAYIQTDASSPPPSRVTSLYVVSTTFGAQPRRLVTSEAGQGLSPFGWSLDGKTVFARVGPGAAAMSAGTQRVSLVSVSVADGKVTTIKAFEPRQGPIQPRLSPDGRFIAYSFVDGPTANRHIFTIDVNGQNERDVVKLAGLNMNPIWSPAGTHLLFWNNLTGNLAVNSTLWSVAVDDGAAAGSPSTVHSGLVGLETLLGMSPSGTLYTFRANEADVKNSQARIFTISVNGSGFREVCGPFPVNRTADLMRWTPDGQSLLFAMAKETKVGWRMMKVPAAGGQPVFDGLDSTNPTGSMPLPTLGPGGPFNIDLSPDGSRMSVGARTQASSELWALENVLSVLSGSR